MVLNMAKCLPTMPAPMITISNQCTEWAGPCTVRLLSGGLIMLEDGERIEA